MKIKLGIIGIGNMGQAHIKNICDGLCADVELTAICDIEVEKLQRVKKSFKLKVKTFKNYKKLIDSGLCDSVLICTRHYDHPAMAIYALEKNLHVLIEKPAGVYTKQVEEMNDCAFKHPELKFGIMYNQRTNPLYQKVRELVMNKEIGEIKRTNWIITNWYRPNAYYEQASWRATWKYEGGGVLLNQDPHQLDLWQWICGMPTKIRAFCKFGSNRNIPVEDDVTCYAEYPNGATGVFVTSVHDIPGTNRFEISGTKGQLIIENGILTFYKLSVDEKEFSKENKIPFGKPGVEKIVYDIKENIWGVQHADLLNNFADSVLRNTELLAPGQNGINGLKISNAMHISTLKNKDVNIDELEKENYKFLLNKLIKEEGLK